MTEQPVLLLLGGALHCAGLRLLTINLNAGTILSTIGIFIIGANS